jgi:translation initiation factor 1 (eIF-1/SUI1)
MSLDPVVTKPGTKPVGVVYCGVCGVPPEYCCYGNKWELCKEWINENFKFESEEIKTRLLNDWENTFQNENRSKQKTGTEKEGDDSPVKFVTITVNNRGKKSVTEIHGMFHYTSDLKTVCSKVKKKFACSAIVTGASMKGRKGERNTKKQEKWQEREKEMQNRKLKKNGIAVADADSEKKNTKQPTKNPTQSPEEFIEAQGDISHDLAQFITKEFNIPENQINKIIKK